MDNSVTLRAVVGEVLNVKVYRGFATLYDLARISRGDIYDFHTNPAGTQRLLDVRHAKKAYDYALKSVGGSKRFWPEIVLNIRRTKGIKVTSVSKVKGGGEFVKININLDVVELTEKDPAISRVDGNHRLHFAEGFGKKKQNPLIHVSGPFAITTGLDSEEELQIFRDINNNQKSMNTSHLDNILVRLSTEDRLFKENRALWLAQQLSKRDGSPFRSKVYSGGKKERGLYLINLRGLESAIKELLNACQLSESLSESDKLYKLIENYWNAVKKVWSTEWSDTKNYKLMTNAPGLTALGRVGGKLLDTQLRKHKVKLEDLETCVAQFRSHVSWAKASPDMIGMAGPGAARKIADQMGQGLPEEVDVETIEL